MQEVEAKEVLDMIAKVRGPSGPVVPELAKDQPQEKVIDEVQIDEKEDKDAKFVIGMGRRRDAHRPVCTLHSRWGCWRGRDLAFSSFELVMTEEPDAGTFDLVCKVCWPAGPPVFGGGADGTEKDLGDESSSSTSS